MTMYRGKARNDLRMLDVAREPLETTLQELAEDNLMAEVLESKGEVFMLAKSKSKKMNKQVCEDCEYIMESQKGELYCEVEYIRLRYLYECPIKDDKESKGDRR